MTSKRALLVAVGASLVFGCGGSTKRTVRGKVATPKLPPAKPEALRYFDSGMRALRLGGPEADQKAKERLLLAVEKDSRLWEGWHNLGVIYSRQGEDRKAADAFSKALSINPAHVPTLLARAEALRGGGAVARARKDYKRALSQMGDDVDDDAGRKLYRNTGARLASLLRESRRYEDALDSIREVLRIAGANAKVYVELGLIYLAQGRSDLARLVLAKAAKIDAKEPSIYNAQALIALEAGQAQEAFNRFDYATSLAPNYLDARFNKAAVLLDAGDYARGKTELEIVVKADPSNMSALVALGVAHRGLKELAKAKAAWERVVKRAPRSSNVRGDALYNLAVLQMDHLQKTKEARAALDRYLQNAPKGHPQRKQARDRKKELGP